MQQNGMSQGLQVKQVEATFWKENCIICLKSGEIKSARNGRQHHIINVATIRKDVLEIINSLNDRSNFVYHVSSQYCKS